MHFNADDKCQHLDSTDDKCQHLDSPDFPKDVNKDEIDALKEANKSLSVQVQKLLEKEEQRDQERMEARRKAREAQRASLEKQRIEAERSRGFFSKLFS